MNWQEISGCWVLMPPRPKAILHFLGGAFFASAPHLTYRCLLEYLSQQGYLIIATPFVNTLVHTDIAEDVLNRFETTLQQLHRHHHLGKRYLPIYGLGHSMGCKLHLLIGSLFPVQRAGNILISYNNFTAREAIPGVEQLSPVLNMEFTPTPAETHQIIQTQYQVRRNLLVKFSDDTLDQTLRLSGLLQQRFPGMITVQRLTGTHQTPLGQDIQWSPASTFSPIDALGQWVKQAVYRDLNRLKQEILRWLNPLAAQ